jgi:hypothetical protein
MRIRKDVAVTGGTCSTIIFTKGTLNPQITILRTKIK